MSTETMAAIPLHIQTLEKHLDLAAFIDQLESMFSSPVMQSDGISVDNLDTNHSLLGSVKSLWTDKASRKKDIAEFYNFKSIGKRKWLKNLLLDDSDSDSDEPITDEDIRILLKIHKYRRKYQKKYHTDIMNSQYTYYGAGLLSEQDLFPEHQKFVVEQYGCLSELGLSSDTNKTNSTVNAKCGKGLTNSTNLTMAPQILSKNVSVASSSKKRPISTEKTGIKLDQSIGSTLQQPISIMSQNASTSAYIEQTSMLSTSNLNIPKVSSIISSAPFHSSSSIVTRHIQQPSSSSQQQFFSSQKFYDSVNNNNNNTTTTTTTNNNNNNNSNNNEMVVNAGNVAKRQKSHLSSSVGGLGQAASTHVTCLSSTMELASSLNCSSSSLIGLSSQTTSVVPRDYLALIASLDVDETFRNSWRVIVNEVLPKAFNEKYIAKTYRAVVLKNIAMSCVSFLSQANNTQSPTKAKKGQKKKSEITGLRPINANHTPLKCQTIVPSMFQQLLAIPPPPTPTPTPTPPSSTIPSSFITKSDHQDL